MTRPALPFCAFHPDRRPSIVCLEPALGQLHPNANLLAKFATIRSTLAPPTVSGVALAQSAQASALNVPVPSPFPPLSIPPSRSTTRYNRNQTNGESVGSGKRRTDDTTMPLNLALDLTERELTRTAPADQRCRQCRHAVSQCREGIPANLSPAGTDGDGRKARLRRERLATSWTLPSCGQPASSLERGRAARWLIGVLIDTCIWASAFAKPGSREHRSVAAFDRSKTGLP